MIPAWLGSLAWMLASSSVRAALVAAAVSLVLAALRVHSGSVRHAAWAMVLAAMLAMPVLPMIVPPIPIPLGAPGASNLAVTWLGDADPAASPGPDTSIGGPLSAPPAPATGARTAPATASATELTAAPPATRRTSDVPSFLAIVATCTYGVGLLYFLARLLAGWAATRRLVAASNPSGDVRTVIETAGVVVCESSRVAAPLTVGVFSRRVILPTAWRSWPEEQLRAVLAHECAHARRRDPLVALLAHVNRAVFWFHPLAWWLEHALAATAEQACDEVAVQATATPRRYAEVLLDIADSVRQRRGRVAWQGVGADGTGLLGQRIDRILRGELVREVSMTRKLLVAAGCAAAIVLVVACRAQQPPPAPLEPKLGLTEQMTAEKRRVEVQSAARALTAPQVAGLEAALKTNPEDLGTLRKLLTFYAPVKVKAPDGTWSATCAQVVGESACVEARRTHILWLIEHHPEDELAGDWGARIFINRAIDPLADPQGYEAAKKIWLDKTAPPDPSVAVLRNASWFFEVPDKALAEKMLLRLQAADPGGRWSAARGRLYAFVIMGSNASTPLNVVWTVDPAQAHGKHAQEVREKLARTTDVEMLLSAARHLDADMTGKLDFDPRALSRGCLERALQLDPSSSQARTMAVGAKVSERSRRLREILRDVPNEREYEVLSALPEAERFALLPWQAELTYMRAEGIDDWEKHDKAAAAAGWERSRKYAEDALRLAPKFEADPGYGSAVFRANVTLGTIAMRNGDKAKAVDYLRAAGKAPPSDELAYYSDGMWTRLAVPLLKYGERESVAEFLDRYARLSVIGRDRLAAGAADIRAGRMPDFYQYQTTQAGR
jgi:beta-lactamase regulating signal transducer with metallopeptidase domain